MQEMVETYDEMRRLEEDDKMRTPLDENQLSKVSVLRPPLLSTHQSSIHLLLILLNAASTFCLIDPPVV
jgi:hypothetical protein